MMQLFDALWNDFLLLKKNFNRLISIGLLFALICHFYVIEPYFLYKAEEKNAIKKLKESEEQLKKLSGQLSHLETTYKDVHLALENIKTQIKSFPDHLRRMLPKIKESLSPSDYAIQEARLFFPTNIKTFEEGVNWYIKDWFKKIINDLQNKVINPVSKLKVNLKSSNKTTLTFLSQDAMRKIHRYIDRVDPNFWRSYERGKIPVTRGLTSVVEESFEPIYKEINRLMNEVDNAINLHKKKLKKIESALIESQKEVKELESRLESLESPIGKILVGLTDFIKLFPITIVILIVTITIYFSKSKELYTILWDEISSNMSDANKTILQKLIKCWYLPPYQSIIQPILLSIVMFTLVGIFMRSVFLIIKKTDLFISIIGKKEIIMRSIFISTYIIGAFVMIGCVLFILKQLKGKN